MRFGVKSQCIISMVNYLQKKRFDEIYVSVKFSNFDSQSLIPDFFINWALFNPNYSSYLKALGHSLSVTVPVAKKQYDEMYILKTVQ